MDKQQQQQQQQPQEQEQDAAGFMVSLDESFFFYDPLVRVWIDKNKRPIVRITGSHAYMYLWSSKYRGKTSIQTVPCIQRIYIPQLSKENTYQISKMFFVYG